MSDRRVLSNTTEVANNSIIMKILCSKTIIININHFCAQTGTYYYVDTTNVERSLLCVYRLQWAPTNSKSPEGSKAWAK